MAAGHLVEQTAGRGDDHVRAASERRILPAIADAAIHGDDAHGQAAAQLLRVVGDLERELARRRHDQRTRLARAGRRDQPLQQRQQERRRLAGARLGRAEDVVPLQGGRDGRALDGRGLLKAHGSQIALQAFVKTEICELQNGLLCCG